MNEAARRTLMTRGGALAALSQHPSWAQLEDEVGRKQQKIERHFIARAMRMNEPIDQREADYLRGFIHGMRWLVAVPTHAESSLERFLKQQGVALEGDEQ
ncbi:MAG TPA: hypothetical protein VFG86_05935 [Chloroflexota bacterium]|jgi:hypothetical protein|nr:hypothetical protein [Chloroflexota bacterium]